MAVYVSCGGKDGFIAGICYSDGRDQCAVDGININQFRRIETSFTFAETEFGGRIVTFVLGAVWIRTSK